MKMSVKFQSNTVVVINGRRFLVNEMDTIRSKDWPLGLCDGLSVTLVPEGIDAPPTEMSFGDVHCLDGDARSLTVAALISFLTCD